jgi:hypothetical protein
MSFRFGCWLRGMQVRLSGKRPRPTAGIPLFARTTAQDPTRAAYVFGTPLNLNQCNDLYSAATRRRARRSGRQNHKTGLIHFVNNDCWRCQACHPGSDRVVNVARCVSSGLILYEALSNGSPPYNYNPTT